MRKTDDCEQKKIVERIHRKNSESSSGKEKELKKEEICSDDKKSSGSKSGYENENSESEEGVVRKIVSGVLYKNRKGFSSEESSEDDRIRVLRPAPVYLVKDSSSVWDREKPESNSSSNDLDHRYKSPSIPDSSSNYGKANYCSNSDIPGNSPEIRLQVNAYNPDINPPFKQVDSQSVFIKGSYDILHPKISQSPPKLNPKVQSGNNSESNSSRKAVIIRGGGSTSRSNSHGSNSSDLEDIEDLAAMVEEDFHLRPINENPEASTGDLVQVTLKIATQPIVLEEEKNQEIPCMVEFEGLEQEISQRAGIDAICVIDVSGSMSGKKLDLVKRTLNFMVKRLESCDRVSLITFSDNSKVLSPLVCMTDAGKESLSKVISKMHTEGSTEIISGITKAMNLLSLRKVPNQVTSIIILTVGKDNSHITALNRFEKAFALHNKNIPTGFVIHTFGYGSDHQTDLMNAMANKTNGGFYYIEEESFIPKAFSDCLGEMMSVVADSVTVELVELPGRIPYVLSKVYSETGEFSFRMPPILAGNTKETVFTLKFLKTFLTVENALEELVVKAKVEYKLAESQRVVKSEHFLKVVALNKNYYHQVETDENVMVQFYRAKCAEILKLAADLADDGRLKEAKEIVFKGIEECRESLVAGKEAVIRLIDDLEKSIPRFVDKKVYESVGRADLRAKASKTQNKRCEYKNKVQKMLFQEAEEEFDDT